MKTTIVWQIKLLKSLRFELETVDFTWSVPSSNASDQRSQNSPSVSVTGMLRSTSNESRGIQFTLLSLFSLLLAFGLRSESFQQKCNTIACLQFDHVQYFKSTDRLALHLSVNLTRNTVKEDPSAPCAWIAYVHMPECCKCTLCMACILNTPRCFTRRSDIRDYSTIR